MHERNSLDEDYGPIGSLIGAGSHLAGTELDELLSLISLELMRRATVAGLPEDASRVFRQVLLLWMRRLQASPYEPRRVVFQTSDFPEDVEAVERGLEVLSRYLPVERETGWHGDVAVDLSPWLEHTDRRLIADIHRQWLSRHIAAVQRACHGAELMIESYLDPNLPQSLRAGASERLVQLQARWDDLKGRLRYSRPLRFDEAMENPWALYDEVAELEHLHDCVVGLQADPDGAPMLFSELWKREGPAKLQALGLPPRTHPEGPKLRIVGGADGAL